MEFVDRRLVFREVAQRLLKGAESVIKRVNKTARFGLSAVALAVIAVPMADAFASAEETAALTAEQVAKGRQAFADNGCSACHTLADANAAGSIGPAFDGNANLDKARAVNVITNGQGAMPNYGWLGEEDIDLLASYIVQTKK
jgi:mono/diheme cytochrome c family protein